MGRKSRKKERKKERKPAVVGPVDCWQPGSDGSDYQNKRERKSQFGDEGERPAEQTKDYKTEKKKLL